MFPAFHIIAFDVGGGSTFSKIVHALREHHFSTELHHLVSVTEAYLAEFSNKSAGNSGSPPS